MSDTRRLAAERDLYRELLRLGASTDHRQLCEAAVERIVAATGARQGYLATLGADGAPQVQILRDCDPEQVRGVLSGSIVRAALASGRTVSTASASEDPRFREQRSVAMGKLTAVLCAPIPPGGVLCLQGRDAPGPFSEEDRLLVELFAAQLAPWVERLAPAPADPTERWRARLHGAHPLAGRSPALAELLEQLALVAPLDVSVLLTGPSGAGKTSAVTVLHASGPRARGPLVELNCAALPENLVESELFGAERGAHSAADKSTPGKVEAAEGGTLFLDEVGDLPLPAQAKLLQFLQSRVYYRLGSTRPRTADVRVVAATNVDLLDAIERRAFREDLYWRLAVWPVRVPGLAERREDIGVLAAQVLEAVARRHHLPVTQLGASALAALRAADWPGNVRQLAHVVEAGAIRAAGRGGGEVGVAHLFPGGAEAPQTLQAATREFQRQLLEETLRSTDWNVSECARRLDVSRSHLNELVRGFELRRPA